MGVDNHSQIGQSDLALQSPVMVDALSAMELDILQAVAYLKEEVHR